MTAPEPYPTARGVENAIQQAARQAADADPALRTDQRIRLEHFRRFLSRIFSEGATSEWLLKGGTGLLARVPSARATIDIDLHRSGYGLDEALEDLRRLATIDLADHFRFVYVRHKAILAGDEQPNTNGYRVDFDTYIGAQKKGSIRIDLSMGAGLTAEATVMAPASALDLPKLVAFDYRLYPVVDQIADKVCATMQLYAGQPSSREKDLVDLVVLAVTQDIDGTALAVAIRTEALRRCMEPFDRFAVPAGWGSVYRNASRNVPYCSDFRHIEAASKLATALIDPVLDGCATGKVWRSTQRAWSLSPHPAVGEDGPGGSATAGPTRHC